MSVWNVALGMSVVDNPLVDSPFCQEDDVGFSYPPFPRGNLLTESGLFILTENLEFLATE